MKVRRIKDAFDRPFRNKATSGVFSVGSQVPRGADDAVVPASTGEKFPEVAGPTALSSKVLPVLPSAQCGVKDKAKEQALMRNQNPEWGLDSPPPTASSGAPSRPPREPSPVWDIELDLNDDEDLDCPPTSSPSTRPPREPLPVCDIELDLNDDDLYMDMDPRLAAKKQLGQAGNPLGSDK